jgi:hypothetical protein
LQTLVSEVSAIAYPVLHWNREQEAKKHVEGAK